MIPRDAGRLAAAHVAAPTSGTIDRDLETRRFTAAFDWRLDNANNPWRDDAWRWYCQGAIFRVTNAKELRSIRNALYLAQSAVAWVSAA